MDPPSVPGHDEARRQGLTLPTVLRDDATILVVGAFDPSEHAICLQLLAKYGRSGDRALVVSTLESADETIDEWEQVSERADRPTIGIVDTTSEAQSILATYGGVPTCYTPSSGDLERIVLALSELTGSGSLAANSRHLVFRSLTPILKEAPTERVCRVIERISGLRTGTGLGLFGIDFTCHDSETLTSLSETVDGVVWIDRTKDGRFEIEFHADRPSVSFRP